MKNRKQLLGLLFGITIVGVFIANAVLPTHAISNTDPDFIAIQSVLTKFSEIKAQAKHTLDDSQLTDVLANDPRGGHVDDHFLPLVREMQGNPNLKIEDIGYLDIYQARYSYDRLIKQMYDDAISKGQVNNQASPFEADANPISIDIRGTKEDPSLQAKVPNPATVPEIHELAIKVGMGASLPVSNDVETQPMSVKLLSVSIDDKIAHGKVAWSYGLCDDTFVKIDDHWYLIGERIVEDYGG